MSMFFVLGAFLLQISLAISEQEPALVACIWVSYGALWLALMFHRWPRRPSWKAQARRIGRARR